MSQVSKMALLKDARTFSDLAGILEENASDLNAVLNNHHGPSYTEFKIPKKNGGFRNIAAPSRNLKSIQQKLNKVLTECLISIENDNLGRKKVSHGFFTDRGIISNALPHVGHRYVLNLGNYIRN